MANEAENDDPGAIRALARTVTPGTRGRSDPEMDAIGWGLALGLVILLVPLLPFVLIVWVITRVLDRLDPRGGEP